MRGATAPRNQLSSPDTAPLEENAVSGLQKSSIDPGEAQPGGLRRESIIRVLSGCRIDEKSPSLRRPSPLAAGKYAHHDPDQQTGHQPVDWLVVLICYFTAHPTCSLIQSAITLIH